MSLFDQVKNYLQSKGADVSKWVSSKTQDDEGFIRQGKLSFKPVTNTFNTLKQNNLIGINTYGANKNQQSATDFATGLKQSPVIQFGQTLGKSAASPFVNKTLQKNTQQYTQNISTALKMANQSKTNEEKQRWLNLARQNQQLAQQGSTNIQQEYNKNGLQILGEGLGTAATLIGGPKLTPKTALTMAGISGGLSKLGGVSFAQGAGTGLAYAPVYAGVSQLTNPLLSKVVGLTPVKAKVGGRIVSGLSNVGQGIVSDISTGQKTTPLSMGIDLATGIVGGKGQFDTGINVKGMGDGKLYQSDIDFTKNVLNKLSEERKTGIPNIELRTQAAKLANDYNEGFNIMPKKDWQKLSLEDQYKWISNKLTDLAASGEQIKMGITDQPIKTGEAIQQKGIVPQTGKIKTTLSEKGLLEPSTKESQISQLSISKKGKLNTDKLNITPEQKVAIDQLQDNVPVTVIGNKDVIKQSRLTTGAKRAITDDEMKNRLASQLNSRQEVVSLTRQYEKMKQSGASELELIAQKQKIIDQSRIAQQEGTFAGRLLQARNILANEIATPEQKIYALLDNAGVDSKKYLKDAINVDFNDSAQVVNFYRKYVPPKFGEILDEIRYTNMLSSPLTQIVNTFSNVLQSGIVKPIEKTITGGLDFISNKLTGKERQYFASQGIDYAKGYWKALPEAFNKFKNITSGKEMSIRPDLENIPTATKGALKWYTTPLRTLEASDQFFRTLVESGEKSSLARLKLSDVELGKRAKESADYTLFRQKFDPNGELGQGIVLKAWDKWNSAIQNLRKVPGGNWILPFIQTPTNILKQGFEYSPLGVTTAIGAKRPLEQLSKSLIGTGVFLSLYGIADKGGTTWDVPTNAKEKELFYAAGLQPYSVKIGNKWVSYSKLGPLAYPMAMASALKWVEKNNPDQNIVENLQDALGEMIGFFGDQSYVRSIGDVIDAIKGGSGNMLKNAISGEITNLTGQLVPYRSFQGWLTRMIDPIYRKPEGIGENLMAQVPGLSQNVPAYTDIYGEESKRDLPILNAFSPLKVSVEKPEAADLLNQQQELNIQKALIKKEGEKLGLDEAKDSVKSGGESKVVGNSIIYYDDGVKTLDLTKLDEIKNLPSDNKYNSAIKESKQYSEAAKIMDNTALTTEQQQMALDRLGIDSDKASYYQIANDNDNLKTMFVLDTINKVKTQGGGFSDIIQSIANQRTEVNGKMIASNVVLDNLVDEGIITKSQATQLKKYKMEDGKLVTKSKTGTKAKKVKVTLRKMSAPKLSSSGKIKRIKVPKKTYKKLKVKKLKI